MVFLSGIHEGSIDNILDSYDTMVKVAQENNYDIIGSPTEVLIKNIHNLTVKMNMSLK